MFHRRTPFSKFLLKTLNVQGSPNTFFFGGRNFTKETLSSATSSQQISAKDCRDKKFLKRAVRHPLFFLMSYAHSNYIDENLHDTLPSNMFHQACYIKNVPSIMFNQECTIKRVPSSIINQACSIKHVPSVISSQ